MLILFKIEGYRALNIQEKEKWIEIEVESYIRQYIDKHKQTNNKQLAKNRP